MRRRMIRVGVGALLVLAAAANCARRGGEGAGEEPSSEPVVSVRVSALEERSFDQVMTAPGQWRSGGELVVSAPFAGMVESLTVRVGDPVAAGQRLGLLVTRDSWAALKGAELLEREASDAAARDEAARALRLARRDLVRMPLLAHEAGVVLRRSAEPGAQVSEAGEIVAISPSGTVVFEAHVPASLAAGVHPGQPATVLESGAAPRAASVQRVLPVASGADQAVLVWLAPIGGSPTPGLERFGTAVIVVGAPHRALAVPDSALVEDDLTGQRRVAIVDHANRLAWTPVTLGAAEGGWHELVRSGLPAGTRVVIEGQHGLPGGTQVKPQP
jgi:multidrug efflux pump subunit AcrA (membrane-fusion protein)